MQQDWSSTDKKGRIHIHPNLMLSVIAALLIGISGILTYMWKDYKDLEQKRYEQQTEMNRKFQNEFQSINKRIEVMDYKIERNTDGIKKNKKEIKDINE